MYSYNISYRFHKILYFTFLWLLILGNPSLFSQCCAIPLSLNNRAVQASNIMMGRLATQHCYEDADGNIYTLNIMDVKAWLKNATGQNQVAIITLGGIVGNKAQITYPFLNISPENEYILFLEGENYAFDDKNYRISHPEIMQSLPYAESQGALTYQFGKYHDLLSELPKNEAATFASIEAITHQAATTPAGQSFAPREYETNAPEFFPITTFSPNPTNGGTIVPGDFLNITGSGFGASPGTVFYSNADDGGATFTTTGVASDNVSWSSTAITNKVAYNAGTGPININGTIISGNNLNINYGHLAINSSFFEFAVTTRQKFSLANLNGSGGYTFSYNVPSGFSANTAAKASFERALESWRCATFINWSASGTTTAGVVSDGISSVLFDGSLPANNLGRTTSRFTASASSGCNMSNTVWVLTEIDMQFDTDPPSSGISWQYGPAAPGFNQYDFESIALHELGHGHGLSHRIAPTEVMHYIISNGVAKRNPSAAEIDGGNAKMAYSTQPLCITPGGVNGPMIALNSGNCALVLPIELLAFEAIPNDKSVDLSWSTSSETNNAFFTIERSANGFRYDSIGWMKGAGNSTEKQTYVFTDERPFDGFNYYRLKQHDFDGSFQYSDVRSVTLGNTEQWVGIMQNPAQGDWLRLVVGVQNESLASVEIYNIAGQKLIDQQLELSSGNNFPEININRLVQGIYFAKINCNGQTKLLKFIKSL